MSFRPAAPQVLDPILAAWERLDRRRRGIEPARPGAFLGFELRRHAGRDVALRDGTVVRPGDRIVELHLDNARVRAAVVAGGWSAVRLALADLPAIAAWLAAQPAPTRPAAVHGSGLLAPMAVRAGFEVRLRPRTGRTRLDEWYLRWLLGHWSPEGRSRLTRGRGRLREADAWQSSAAFVARFGPGSG